MIKNKDSKDKLVDLKMKIILFREKWVDRKVERRRVGGKYKDVARNQSINELIYLMC